MQFKVRHRKLRDGKRETVYLDCYDRGRRWLEYLGLYLGGQKSTKETDREALRVAENIAAKRRLEAANDEHGFATRAKQKADFVAYCRKLGESKRSPNTRAVWRNAVRRLEAFTGGPIQFSRVNHSLLQAFKDHLLSQLSPNSALVYLARVKSACAQAVRDRIIPRDPAPGVTIKKLATRREFLTLPELEKLAATSCSNADTKSAFLFACFAGLRYSDVKALGWDQVKGANLEYRQTKTGEPETLPLSAQALAILEAQANASVSPRIKSRVESEAVFKLGAQQTTDKAIRKWLRRAGIEKRISFHCSRHTFATLSLTNGVDIYTVSKLLGHKSLETTEIYAKVIDEKKRQAVGMLPRLKGGAR